MLLDDKVDMKWLKISNTSLFLALSLSTKLAVKTVVVSIGQLTTSLSVVPLSDFTDKLTKTIWLVSIQMKGRCLSI